MLWRTEGLTAGFQSEEVTESDERRFKVRGGTKVNISPHFTANVYEAP